MDFLILGALVAVASGASQQYTTPVPILKQIDKHNEDGSYSYGYEAADGTFKIETKYPDGEVYGKYGYIDDTGSLREVEYGASRRGFEPTGNEIQVPPPTLKVNQNAIARPLAPNEEDDGQYREDPSVYYQNEPHAQPQQKGYQQPTSRYQPQSVYQTEPEYEPEAYRPPYRPEPSYKPSYKPRPQTSYRPQSIYRPAEYYSPESDYRPQPSYSPEPAYRPEPAYKPQSVYRPQPAYNPEPSYYNPQPAYRPQSNFGFSSNNNNYNPPAYNNYGPSFQGHPASNVDINTGSYSVNYKR